jgi:uncharacterized protein YbjT (DUF2867 family)
MHNKNIFITGGSGYVGRAIIPELLKRGHKVTALVRKGSENRIIPGCNLVYGNALDESTFVDKVNPADTFIQLVGISHPSPSKAEQFRAVDLVSAKASVFVAKKSGVKHFIYVSVAHPAPIMKAYIEVRTEVESFIKENLNNATIVRPWYVLGPSHRWPYILKPVFWVFKKIPSTKESALRLDLVNLKQMVRTIVNAVENPPPGIRIIEAQEIKKLGSNAL